MPSFIHYQGEFLLEILECSYYDRDITMKEAHDV